MNAKPERLQHANDLINVIGSYGRRFFFNEKTGEFARLELRSGRVWWIDDYMGSEVFIHKMAFRNGWRGFSHGGTLRSLVEDMRDYITHGTPIARWKIVIQQLGAKGLENNIWGYDEAAAEAVRAAAYSLPIVAAA